MNTGVKGSCPCETRLSCENWLKLENKENETKRMPFRTFATQAKNPVESAVIFIFKKVRWSGFSWNSKIFKLVKITGYIFKDRPCGDSYFQTFAG